MYVRFPLFAGCSEYKRESVLNNFISDVNALLEEWLSVTKPAFARFSMFVEIFSHSHCPMLLREWLEPRTVQTVSFLPP